MENVITITEHGTHEFLASLQYGSVAVQMDSFNSEARIKRAAAAINAIYGMNIIRVEPTEELSEWEDRPIYNIIWSDRESGPPTVTENEIDLPELAMQAFALKKKIILNVSPKVKKYARKCAQMYNIRFTQSGSEMYFNGEDKKPAILPLIKQAWTEGRKFIEFDKSEAEIQTVRVYASQFNSVMETNFSVSVKNGKIRVQLLDPTKEEIIRESAESIYIEAIKELGKETARSIFEGIIFDAEFEEGSVLTQETKTQTTTFNQGSADADAVQGISESGQIYIKDPNIDIDEQNDDDF